MKDSLTYYIITVVTGIVAFVFSVLKFQKTVRAERQEENKDVLDKAIDHANREIQLVKQQAKHEKEMFHARLKEISNKVDELSLTNEKQNLQIVELLRDLMNKD